MQSIAIRLEKDWWEQYWEQGWHLIRLPPDRNFEGGSLRDVLEAHISFVENDPHETALATSDEYYAGDLDWFPTAFIVITSNYIETSPLLLVYADSHNERTDCPVDMFYFRAEDASSMLSSIRLGDSTCADSKEIYAIGNMESSLFSSQLQ